jgi:hypothetical protein
MPTSPLSTKNFYNPTLVGARLNDETVRIDSLVAEAVGDNVDDVTLEVDEGTVQVKDGGIDSPQIAAGAIDEAHLSAAVAAILADFESRIAALEALEE